MKNGFKIVAAIAIAAIAAGGVVVMQQPKEAAPSRGTSPAGYEEYAKAVDPEFCRTVASQLAELGDDPALGFRSAGSPAEEAAANLLAQTMKDIGLENVTVDESETDGWTFGGANITFEGVDGAVTTAALGGYQTNIQANNEKLPIVYLDGTAAGYEDVDVTGKLVLIDIDQEGEWWINYPAYQARVKGARAVVACSYMEEDVDARIGSQDICGDADAPALAISARDRDAIRRAIDGNGYESGGTKQIEVVLNANSVVTEGKGSRNIWGEIPGATDEAIMFIAHYDGYYHSFYDDASGVGMVLGVAKAMRDGGVKPEKTFRFILHGAEEWGKTGTEADWATGAYEQIVNIRPGWAERAFALFNIDSGYPLDSMRSFNINAPAELADFTRASISSFGDRSDVTVTPEISPPSSYREDFIYNACGVPTFATDGGEGDEQYFTSMYHSNMDSLEVGGYNAAGVLGVSRYIGYSALMLDRTPLRPLKFADRLNALRETLLGYPEPLFDSHLMANVDRAIESAKTLDNFIAEFNAEYKLLVAESERNATGGESSVDAESAEKIEKMKNLASKINAGIYGAYRMMQDELLRLDRNLEPGFANEGLQNNLTMLYGARDSLSAGDAESAIYTYLSEIESVYAAIAFDENVYEKFAEGLDDDVKGTWAEGRLASKACRADDVVRSLMSKLGNESAGALYGETSTASAMGGGEGGADVSESAIGDVSGSAIADASGSAVSTDADAPTSGAATGTIDAASEDELFSDELLMLEALIKSQEDALKTVYNNQESSLARLIDGMNELIDAYAGDSDSQGMV
ncbi:MAG: M28 family peptidase [Clostridiales Family XIII bacterium]|jgi:hypothetical protein|nr:M28 family peptidase [Clostridiales Family XIII bacterium]